MSKLPKFINQELFEQAFTHRSYLNEAKGEISSNERLEFLGDSILSFLVSDYLYKEYPAYNEGILTNLRSLLVNTKNLGTIAKNLEFGNLLKLSKGEHEAQGRENQSLLADSFEAFVGALFLDQGLAAVASFVNETLLANVKDFVEKKSFKDPKSLLQEYAQAKKMGSPIYKVTHEDGPAHAKTFTVSVFVANKLAGTGLGRSKQEAEENAAKQALENTGQE
ncbi:MAG: ribonuclease III [Patescibacteria group bacterium]|nr:ribonuclease III [Patescibacteria group bacterium]